MVWRERIAVHSSRMKREEHWIVKWCVPLCPGRMRYLPCLWALAPCSSRALVGSSLWLSKDRMSLLRLADASMNIRKILLALWPLPVSSKSMMSSLWQHPWRLSKSRVLLCGKSLQELQLKKNMRSRLETTSRIMQIWLGLCPRLATQGKNSGLLLSVCLRRSLKRLNKRSSLGS